MGRIGLQTFVKHKRNWCFMLGRSWVGNPLGFWVQWMATHPWQTSAQKATFPLPAWRISLRTTCCKNVECWRKERPNSGVTDILNPLAPVDKVMALCWYKDRLRRGRGTNFMAEDLPVRHSCWWQPPPQGHLWCHRQRYSLSLAALCAVSSLSQRWNQSGWCLNHPRCYHWRSQSSEPHHATQPWHQEPRGGCSAADGGGTPFRRRWCWRKDFDHCFLQYKMPPSWPAACGWQRGDVTGSVRESRCWRGWQGHIPSNGSSTDLWNKREWSQIISSGI